MALDPTLPIRLGVDALRLGLRVAKVPLQVIEHLVGHGQPEGASAPPEAPARRERPRPEERAAPSRPAPQVTVERPEPKPEPIEEATRPASGVEAAAVLDLEPDEPVHVEDEPELVAEFAEPGAEDGAGAELRVEPPFAGYNRMRVADIQDRVGTAGMAELAVIQLYESTHRKRRSVLDAVERRSRQLANEANATPSSNGR